MNKTDELKVNGFSEITGNEQADIDGGFIITSGFIGACVVWGVNAGLAAWGVNYSMNRN